MDVDYSIEEKMASRHLLFLLSLCLLDGVRPSNGQDSITHSPQVSGIPMRPNHVLINVPKRGMGTYVGFSQIVHYNYTLTGEPATTGRRVNCFLGIPYAAPPISDKRFRFPEPAYLDTRYQWDATRFRSACLQFSLWTLPNAEGFKDFSEDCLYLNIFTPNRTDDPPGTLYPVMVHIHGGTFNLGSSYVYPGHALASMGVVVVTFNYRLSVLGFLSTGDSASPGNYGLWDQLLAMKWVRDNIHYFNGDSNKITLAGESAGGTSVGLHLASPHSKKHSLYHQAIEMSGTETCFWAVIDTTKFDAGVYAKELAENMGCNNAVLNTKSMVSCLRNVNVTKLVLQASNIEPKKRNQVAIWMPVVDGQGGFIPRMPIIDRQLGRFAHVPMMTGVVRDEMTLDAGHFLQMQLIDPNINITMCHKGILSFVKVRFRPQFQSETFKKLKLKYCGRLLPSSVEIPTTKYIAMFGDIILKTAVDTTIKSQSKFSNNVYFYEFGYRSRMDKRFAETIIYHGIDIPFIFGFPFMKEASFLTELYRDLTAGLKIISYQHPFDTDMSKFMMELWTNFIKFGNPTPQAVNNINWLPFNEETQNYLHINTSSSIKQRYRQYFFRDMREVLENL